MKSEIVEKILIETERGYDLISGKFSQTRKRFWADLDFIGGYVKDGDKVFDFGCGNGRLFSFLSEKADIEYWGVDVSGKLIEKAKELNSDDKVRFLKIDPRQKSLAFEDGFFNSVYSIAVFHHIPSKAKRLELARELYRVTKSGGQVVITVWNIWQNNYRKNIFQNWKEKIIGAMIRVSPIRSRGSRRESGANDIDWNDCYISFTDNEGKVFRRFHHAFTKRELRKLFEKAGFETERCEIVGGRNIVYVGLKGF